MINPGILSVIPPKIQERLGQFITLKMTGQISLNIKDGKILSYDVKEHGQVTGPFCAGCGIPKHHGRGWKILDRKAYCPDCPGSQPRPHVLTKVPVRRSNGDGE